MSIFLPGHEREAKQRGAAQAPELAPAAHARAASENEDPGRGRETHQSNKAIAPATTNSMRQITPGLKPTAHTQHICTASRQRRQQRRPQPT
jgi:hypothetical protein